MILLVTSLAKAHACAQAIEEATSEPVRICASLSQAVGELQANEFKAVVLDQLLLDAEADGDETVHKYLRSALPVYVNFALSASARVVRELRAALRRRKREMAAARSDAEDVLRHELRDNVTALLLSCEMALQMPGLPSPAEVKMQTAAALARELSTKLGGSA